MREDFLCIFRFNDEMFEISKKTFDDFNKKLTAINEFRILQMKNKDFHFF